MIARRAVFPTPTPIPTLSPEIEKVLDAILQSSSSFQETLSLLVAIGTLAVMLIGAYVMLKAGVFRRGGKLDSSNVPDHDGELISVFKQFVETVDRRDARMGRLADNFKNLAEDVQALAIGVRTLTERLDQFLQHHERENPPGSNRPGTGAKR